MFFFNHIEWINTFQCLLQYVLEREHKICETQIKLKIGIAFGLDIVKDCSQMSQIKNGLPWTILIREICSEKDSAQKPCTERSRMGDSPYGMFSSELVLFQSPRT